MRDRFLAAWRTAAQALFALLFATLTAHGIAVPDTYRGWLLAALLAAGAGVWAAGTHWLQTRTGNAWWAKLARLAGRVLVLGAGSLPVYAPPTVVLPTGPATPAASTTTTVSTPVI